MSIGMMFIIIALIILLILEANNRFNSKRLAKDIEPYFRVFMEDDYEFLLSVKYGGDIDVEKLFSKRVNIGLITIVFLTFIFLSQLSILYIFISFLLGFLMFKLPYIQLKAFYKANLNAINTMLPYYLKGLEILIQHYTVPVALAKSIESAPEIFKDGLKEMTKKIEEGDSSIQPYVDFATEYPVRDSMRMMRLLYRLSLGSQENKQEQLLTFSRTISNLQNKARQQKYQDRLDNMEKQTMIMMFCTGGGVLLFLLLSMMSMISF